MEGICQDRCAVSNRSDVILTGVLSVGDVDLLEFYIKDHEIVGRIRYQVEMCGPDNCKIADIYVA